MLCPPSQASDLILADRTVALFFEGTGYRTRVSFELAARSLGAESVHVPVQLGQAEPTKDTARVVGEWADIAVIRTAHHELLLEYAAWSPVPVINAMTDRLHPCEVLSEVATALNVLQSTEPLCVAFVGGTGNVCQSWFDLASRFPLHLTQVCPPGYEIPHAALTHARETAAGRLRVTHDLVDGLHDADVVYTDTWWRSKARGHSDTLQREETRYQVTSTVMRLAKPDAIFLHAMPAHRGAEVTDDVFESEQSQVFRAKRNLLPAHAALLALVGIGTL